MIIGILWWTWRTWEALRSALLAAKHELVSLIRHPEKFVAKSDKDTYLVWDATKPTDLAPILSHIDILIDATSVGFFHKQPTRLYSRVAQAIVTARPQGTATRLIVMSSAGTHHGRKLPRPANWWYELFLWDVADDKELAEAFLEHSTIPRMMLKSPLLTTGKVTQYTQTPFHAYTPSLFDTVSRQTLGVIINNILMKPQDYLHKKIVYCGSNIS